MTFFLNSSWDQKPSHGHVSGRWTQMYSSNIRGVLGAQILEKTGKFRKQCITPRLWYLFP